MKKLTISTALALLTFQAVAASFDCSKASTYVERTICTDAQLERLDVALAENYKGMLASDFGGSRKLLQEEQLRWLTQRNQCKTAKCLIDAYRKRVDETCDYGVVTGVHPVCTPSEDIK
ncbi:lysozyme inhibitor LprI family protein [Rhodoferax aquaticus]|nr:lysozyme inhibitor LprI family protein [Rhodoferax aquaticus]